MAGGNQSGGRQRVNTSKSGNFKPAAGKAAQIKAAPFFHRIMAGEAALSQQRGDAATE